MKITCVIGPFLPIPPLMGGAVERIFLALCKEFATAGHEVTLVSRRYQTLPTEEFSDGIHHIRIPSSDAPASSLLYRIYDLVYALRVCFTLPRSDVTITHSVSLPIIIPKKRAGAIVVSVARFPKRQMGLYSRVARLQAVSTHIGQAISTQSPSVSHLVKVIPNALSSAFCEAQTTNGARTGSQILYVGRIAREKGIEILVRAFRMARVDHPEWTLTIVGPHKASQGGDGEQLLAELKALCGDDINHVTFVGPVFDEKDLIRHYLRANIFVYPSIAAQGEASPLAPLEAMACGCAVIVSDLPCFADYLLPGKNGLEFDHNDASGSALATQLLHLMDSGELRQRLADEGFQTSRHFTPAAVAAKFLSDFRELRSSLRNHADA